MGQTLLGGVLGAIFAIALAIYVEWMRKPRLYISLGDPTENVYPDDRPVKVARFLHLRVVNQALGKRMRWMTRSTAHDCHGTITFHHLDKQDVFGRAMTLRWSNSVEPIASRLELYKVPGVAIHPQDGSIQPTVLDKIHGRIFDPFARARLDRIDIPAGEEEPFDVAVRFDNEPTAYGWNNEGYYCEPLWRNPDWCLPPGRYLVKVALTSEGSRCCGVFRLINDVPQNAFRLEPAQPGDFATW